LGCHKPVTPSISWDPRIELLKNAESRHSEIYGITKDVETFYAELHDKRWEETYNYRNKSFRKLVPLQVYLDNVTNSHFWELLNYQILSMQINENVTNVTLICKFVENPMQIETYNTIIWEKEDGKWRCDAAGPSGLDLFVKMTK
jgi:hypothetical protein